jgi:hypothetical protein
MSTKVNLPKYYSSAAAADSSAVANISSSSSSTSSSRSSSSSCSHHHHPSCVSMWLDPAQEIINKLTVKKKTGINALINEDSGLAGLHHLASAKKDVSADYGRRSEDKDFLTLFFEYAVDDGHHKDNNNDETAAAGDDEEFAISFKTEWNPGEELYNNYGNSATASLAARFSHYGFSSPGKQK